jgi:hypothetical protein
MFHPAAKLVPKRHGPFPVVRVLSPITYELRLPVQWKLHPVFHVDLLTPYRETEFHGANYDKPPPDLINGEEEYKVERIVASRRFQITRTRFTRDNPRGRKELSVDKRHVVPRQMEGLSRCRKPSHGWQRKTYSQKMPSGSFRI